MPKPFYKSKTFWFNALSIGGAVTGLVPVTVATTVAAGAINVGLRAITTEPVTVKPTGKKE